MYKLKKWTGKTYLITDAKFKIFLDKNKEKLYKIGRKNYKQELKSMSAGKEK